MIRTLRVVGASSVRVPVLQQPALRRPVLRLVVGADDAPLTPRPAAPAQRPPFAAPLVPAAVDEEDAERWDGMA